MKSKIKQIVDLGFTEITTKRQRINGTIMFQNNSNVSEHFGIYIKSGYVRRLSDGLFGCRAMYQLNKKIFDDKMDMYQRVILPNQTSELFNILTKYLIKKNSK